MPEVIGRGEVTVAVPLTVPPHPRSSRSAAGVFERDGLIEPGHVSEPPLSTIVWHCAAYWLQIGYKKPCWVLVIDFDQLIREGKVKDGHSKENR